MYVPQKTVNQTLEFFLRKKFSPTCRTSIYESGGKRALDLGLVVLTATLSLPIIAILAILVAMDGHNPFFSQLRVGKGGKTFRLWKLRSMIVDADQHLESHLNSNPAARAEWDSTQKLKNDPRITPIGRIIRKTSLDELPQLLNVLFGQMSLVGPRPMLLSQRELYSGQAYYALLPGITGNWQISDRNEGDFSRRESFDAKYEKTICLKTDFSILLGTIGTVVGATGY